ncbi:MAG: carboxypeptidase-like regulatory domain-containing protein [Terriglobales bacterium]
MKSWSLPAGAIVGLILIITLPTAARKRHPEPPACTLSFVILKGDNDLPIRNAAVVLHPVNRHDKQENGGLELKTDAEGKASYDGIPYGKLRVQVLAHGFQTFGQDYDIEQPALEVTVKMKRPAGQYSIYEDHPADQDKDKKDAAPDASKPQ